MSVYKLQTTSVMKMLTNVIKIFGSKGDDFPAFRQQSGYSGPGDRAIES
jgi:hypothetical protein